MAETTRIPEAWPGLLSREQLCAYLGVCAGTLAKVCPVAPVDLGANVVRWNRTQISARAGLLNNSFHRAAKEKPMLETTAHNVRTTLIGQHCVVRTYSAGVHLGEVVAKDGTQVLLKDARRLWKWNGAFTLSEVAIAGVSKTGSRIAVAVPLIELTQAVEIIPTTDAARSTFDACHE